VVSNGHPKTNLKRFVTGAQVNLLLKKGIRSSRKKRGRRTADGRQMRGGINGNPRNKAKLNSKTEQKLSMGGRPGFPCKQEKKARKAENVLEKGKNN